nr:MAG TPA: Hint (Hedgehog/Intein) domain C-terminal region [Caudoviricetes sp.]
MKMSDDICHAYCVGNSKAILRARSKGLYTFELEYPRFIHSEFMTHRCLTADTVLTFDLPTGQSKSKHHVYTMTLGEFWDKWENGSAPHATRWGGVRRYNLRGRLNKMRLRAVDESAMEIMHTTIKDCWKVGIKPVYLLSAGDYKVKCTADHLILTDNGWKELQDIVPFCDKVYCNTRKKYEKPPRDPYRKINGMWVSSWNKRVLPEVLEQQNYCCYDCGCTEGSFELHHVIPRYQHPELAFDLSNVVALCHKCHKERHAVQGWQGVSQCNLLPVEVDSVEYVGEEEVFDISVSSDYHNFLANGIVVHNCFSRNASSSRAVPVEKTIQNILNEPWKPLHVYKNCRGMQGKELVSDDEYDSFCEHWDDAKLQAIEVAHKMIKEGFHKQHINRILEPFTKIKVIVTATEWDNFFKLRLARDADPEIQDLAKAIKLSMDNAAEYIYVNALCDCTLPYVNIDEIEAIEDRRMLKLISAARCARVSYLNHDGSAPDILKDLKLAKHLIESGHMTPFEHQCRGIFEGDAFYYNLRNFQSARYMLDHGINLSAS